MGIIDVASGESIWRGKDYYDNKNVLSYAKINDCIYDGVVKGNNNNLYNVHIETDHPRKSTCNCPFANGRRVICKHMIALYFTAIPDALSKFMEKVEAYEEEEKRQKKQHYAELKKYVNSLSKSELQEKYFSALVELEELNNRRGFW